MVAVTCNILTFTKLTHEVLIYTARFLYASAILRLSGTCMSVYNMKVFSAKRSIPCYTATIAVFMTAGSDDKDDIAEYISTHETRVVPGKGEFVFHELCAFCMAYTEWSGYEGYYWKTGVCEFFPKQVLNYWRELKLANSRHTDMQQLLVNQQVAEFEMNRVIECTDAIMFPMIVVDRHHGFVAAA